MQTVYKFHVPFADTFTVEMPKHSTIGSFQYQRDRLVMWAVCDPSQPNETRRFMLVMTGEERNDLVNAVFIGTATDTNNGLVSHLFEGFAP